MKLQSIQLANFRAFERLSISLGERVTLLIGENGSGKTSILDAIGIGLGAILTHLPDVKGLTFKKTDLRSQHEQKAPYMPVVLETTEGLAWERMVKRDKSQLTAKQLPQSLGLKKLEHYLDATVIEPAVLSVITRCHYSCLMASVVRFWICHYAEKARVSTKSISVLMRLPMRSMQIVVLNRRLSGFTTKNLKNSAYKRNAVVLM